MVDRARHATIATYMIEPVRVLRVSLWDHSVAIWKRNVSHDACQQCHCSYRGRDGWTWFHAGSIYITAFTRIYAELGSSVEVLLRLVKSFEDSNYSSCLRISIIWLNWNSNYSSYLKIYIIHVSQRFRLDREKESFSIYGSFETFVTCNGRNTFQ